MELEHEFTVPVGVDEAWQVLLDVERIAPCMPGATVLDVRGDEFAGTVKVKVGPITMTYAGDAKFAEKDEAARRVVVEAAGKENRGSGTAKATMTATLEPSSEPSNTLVHVLTDLTVTGRPAQFGRGMLQDVGGRLIGQFADNLAATLQAGEGADAAGEQQVDSAAEAAATESATGESATAEKVTALQNRTTESSSGRSDSAEALDLLDVTGVSGAVSRYRVPIAAGAVVGLSVLFWLVRRRKRR